MTRAEQMAWAAGVIEGEGTLTRNKGFAVIAVEMADKDVIHTLASLWPETHIHGPKPPQTGKPISGAKYTYRWVSAKQIRVLNILGEIRPYLHSRRGAKADQLMDEILERITRQEK